MSTTTTHTTPAYRPAYVPAGGPIRVQSTCPCGQTFPDLGGLFGHDCPDDLRKGAGRPRPAVDLTPADSQDRPVNTGGAGRSRPGAPATDAQLRLIAKLAAEKAIVVETDGLSKASASRLIDTLIAADGPATIPAPATTDRPCRPNRYAGTCTGCGGEVPAGAGQLCKTDGRWTVSHTECPETAAEPTPTRPATTTRVDVPAGHYAIPSTGDNDLVFYRVDRPTEGTYAGVTFVKMIVGGHPDRNVRREAVAGILERIAADPDAAARYGRELGRCCRCNRSLTDETSRALGIGPECRKA